MAAITKQSRRKALQHIRNLGSEDVRMANRSESTLEKYYAHDFAEDLIGAAQDEDPCIRFRIGTILAYEKISGAFDVLVANLSDSEDKVRYQAALDLGVLGDPRAIPPLIELITKDDNTGVDLAASIGLGKLGDASIPALLSVVGTGSRRVTEMAIEPLVQIGSPLAIQALELLASSPVPLVREIAQGELAYRGS